MRVLEGLEPQSVFYLFEEICRIPHGSGNVGQISDYLKGFAKERGLFCIQDALGNIIIVREASPAYEGEEPYILQAHMDMVAVTVPGSQIDMTREPLKLKTEDGEVFAEDTSLGGDDGIGVAFCLALLDAKELSLPRLEVVLTVDEETGMEGAAGIDLSMLRGRRMINLDQEEEGIFVTSCAGGARVDVEIPVERELPDFSGDGYQFVKIAVTGLLGGHSGIEIDRGRGNANCLLGQVLRAVEERCPIRLCQMQGGVADNAIPREAGAVLAVEEGKLSDVEAAVKEQEEKIRGQIAGEETGFQIVFRAGEKDGKAVFVTPESTKRALACLENLPNGIVAMSRDVEGLVETSLNLGILSLDTSSKRSSLRLQYAVRSSVDREKESLCERIRMTAEKAGAAVSVRNSYPGWAYRRNSPLRERMVRIYEKMYGKAPELQAIHAGLECGLLAGKIENLDCVSVGPDLKNVHTAKERMDIESVGRVWAYLLEVLTQKGEP